MKFEKNISGFASLCSRLIQEQSQTSPSLMEEVVYLDVSLRLRGLFTFVYLWMDYRIPEKVILRRVLAFYFTAILETGTGVKKRFAESLMHYCSTGGSSTVLKRTVALLFSIEGNRCSTFLNKYGVSAQRTQVNS